MPVAEKDFAIVTDSSCDLPASFLERAGVAHVELSSLGDSADAVAPALERAYRNLAARGYARVVSVHSAPCFSPALEAARRVMELEKDEPGLWFDIIRTEDSGATTKVFDAWMTWKRREVICAQA